VVIEAVFEQLELKLEVFEQLDRLCPARTVLASNSSTLWPSKLAAATRRPAQVLIAHYFNPPYLLPLVELVRNPATSDATVDTMYGLLTRVGKKPAIVQKEVVGFIGNRLQAALFREALSLVERGIASAEDVDTVVKNGFGRRYAAAGPFEIWELAGWDFILAALQYLTLMKEELGNEWLEPHLFRIGASSLLTDIERQLEHHVTGAYSAAHRHAQP